jgi:hypothetical protein
MGKFFIGFEYYLGWGKRIQGYTGYLKKHYGLDLAPIDLEKNINEKEKYFSHKIKNFSQYFVTFETWFGLCL